jgi:menaquinone-dependent protoporphyrinogen oxidase
MRILIVHGSTQGQTRKIAEFAAERWRDQGHDVAVFDAALIASTLDPLGYDVTLVAASLHAGTYQPAVVRFVRDHAPPLASVPSAFISVSLSAAGNDAGDLAGLKHAEEAFFARTGWHPAHVHHAAGALAYTQYNVVVRWFMKRFARARGASVDASRDYEFTDYTALAEFLDAFLVIAGQPTPAPPPLGRIEARWANR